jgi:hypothetical protein
MRQIAGLVVLLFISSVFMAAEAKDKAAGMEMTGVVCHSKCVKQDAEKSSCDANCKEKSGDVVFIDDQGKSFKIANQKMAKSHAGKKVKMKGKMKGEMMDPTQILDLGAYGPG